MTKTYLRYQLQRSVGVVVSPDVAVLVDPSGRLAIAAALEDVIVWNVKQGTQVSVMHASDDLVVTALALDGAGDVIAAGYSDGSIRLWRFSNGDLITTFTGHRKAIVCMAFNGTSSQLVSGAKDTDLVVWDVVGQTGLFRLRGHRDAVTCVRFFGDDKFVVSSSKDTLLKVWDLSSQHCVQTAVGHRAEIWSFAVNADSTRLVSGTSDAQLRVWKLDAAPAGAQPDAEFKDGETSGEPAFLQLLGTINRQTSDRVSVVTYDAGYEFLAVQSISKAVEIYRVADPETIKKKAQRRRRRAREKKARKAAEEAAGAAGAGDEEDAAADADADADDTIKPTDELQLLTVLRTEGKIKSCGFAGRTATHISLLLASQENELEMYSIAVEDGSHTLAATVSMPGHRSSLRAVAVGPDGHLSMCTAKNELKLWNVVSGKCIRTMETGFGLCCQFAPGGRHGIVGTKDGRLQLFDLATGDMIEEHKAHDGAVWSLDVRRDGKGFVTGSADKTVKFWEFDLVAPEGGGAPQLACVHTRTLKMSDDVLCVRYSNTRDPTKLLVAIALLDCTVKVFFDDTLKFFLSLYGHKLPVMSMDISSDSTLLVTGSADKNVKIWGLDFGDCHRSLFAHNDSVMSVVFVPGTHLFFTAGKDGLVKHWDADVFEPIFELPGHKAEVWALGVAVSGDFLVSGGHDRSLRLWSRTEEQVFIEEEKERRLEAVLEKEMNEAVARDTTMGTLPESGPAARQTTESVRAADQLLEALALCRKEQDVWTEYFQDLAAAESELSSAVRKERQAKLRAGETVKPLMPEPDRNILLMNLTPAMYMLRVLQRVPSAELDEALSVLPFAGVQELLRYLLFYIRKGIAPELAAKCVSILVRLHHNQLSASGATQPLLLALRTQERQCLEQFRDHIGYTRAGLQCIADRLANMSTGFGPAAPQAPAPITETVITSKAKRRRLPLF